MDQAQAWTQVMTTDGPGARSKTLGARFIPMALGLALSWIFIPSGLLANPGLYDRSWAVVIGIDRYQHWPPLEAAVEDARAVRERLRRLGFDQITFLTDGEATRTAILTEIGTNLRLAAGANDRVLIYFAGHGYTEELPNKDQVGYIIPVEAPKSNFFAHAISMQQIRETFGRLRAKHIYYVMDCCFSGHGFTRSAGIAPEIRDYLNVVTERRAVQMITAGRKGDFAHEQGRHGIFTLYLLRGLDGEADLNGDGVVTASELGAFVQPGVFAASDRKQLPQYGRLDGEGEVVFLTARTAPPRPSPEPLEALTKQVARLQDQLRRLEEQAAPKSAAQASSDSDAGGPASQPATATSVPQVPPLSPKADPGPEPLRPLRPTASAKAELPRRSGGGAGEAGSPGGSRLGKGELAAARFTDNGDGTVTDGATGLQWQYGGSEEPLRFSEAVQYVHRLNSDRFGGHSDWRIPRIEELKGLLQGGAGDPIGIQAVFDSRIKSSWSSTQSSVASGVPSQLVLYFKDGSTRARIADGGSGRARAESSARCQVRAVRGAHRSRAEGHPRP
jgi:uncharacterized caspase-like protein